jgi:hypothetical protein
MTQGHTIADVARRRVREAEPALFTRADTAVQLVPVTPT